MTTDRVEIIKRKTTLYTADARGVCRHPFGRCERTRKFTLGCRGYAIINQGGFDGSFGNQSKRQIL
ncbi:hypothetical protein LI328DRAFT_134964 [Trichoderma asperelloides]|nr:hypothetical protein LI328DRAFT_134964 [Trichoderma asperelloides]